MIFEKATEGQEVHDDEVEDVYDETASFMASGIPSTTPLVARINELESPMLDGKLVLVGDDGGAA